MGGVARAVGKTAGKIFGDGVGNAVSTVLDPVKMTKSVVSTAADLVTHPTKNIGELIRHPTKTLGNITTAIYTNHTNDITPNRAKELVSKMQSSMHNQSVAASKALTDINDATSSAISYGKTGSATAVADPYQSGDKNFGALSGTSGVGSNQIPLQRKSLMGGEDDSNAGNWFNFY